MQNKKDLGMLCENIRTIAVNMRHTVAKFTELDLNKNGRITGDGLFQLTEWLLNISSTCDRVVSKLDVIIEKEKILQRFSKELDGFLIMREVAVLYEEAEVAMLFTSL